MRKHLLFFAAALLSVSLNAQTPAFKWSYKVDTAYASDAVDALTLASDGKLVSVSHFASRLSTDKFTFNGEEIATGCAIDGTSDNQNLVVMKHNEDGSKAWAFSSVQGYVSGASCSSLTPTSDGGVVMLLKPRSAKVSSEYLPLVFVESDGNEVEIDEWNCSGWYYNAMVLKVTSDGKLGWYKIIRQDQAKGTDSITPNALTIDGDGNVFVGGSFKGAMVIEGEKNSCYVVSPNKTAESLFFVKLDKDGNYVSHMASAGTAPTDKIYDITADGDKLYFVGTAKGAVDQTFGLGDKTVTLANGYETMFVGAVSNDLKTVDYLNLWNTLGNKNPDNVSAVIQIKRLQVLDGALWVMGAINGGIALPGSQEDYVRSSDATKLDGFAIKMNLEDGAALGQMVYGNTISGWYYAFKQDDNIYLYGYRMNVADGANITLWDPEAETPTRHLLATQGGAPTANDGAYDSTNKVFYFAHRGNKIFEYLGKTLTEDETTALTPTGTFYSGYITAFSFAESSSVEETAASSFSVEGSNGKIVVKSSEARPVAIYNAAGLAVFNGEIQPGVTEIPVESGVYVADNAKILVK